MKQQLNSRSITIDKFFAASRRLTKILELGLEGMRLGRTRVDRAKRGDQ
jgi:hypothetical protein